ncbi:hypothetical protein [Nonomuraea sp. NPDC049480]|uniref:hypothetical protein n=1 Tax=Nonomuraea sp. NPDC049480 TaxID=3364353 RepID=UPI00378D06D4
MGHGGGQHKKAPGIVAECDFAVAAADVPGHGDRPKDEEYDRIATENQARVDAGEEPAPLIAAFQALVARPVRTPPRPGVHGGVRPGAPDHPGRRPYAAEVRDTELAALVGPRRS